MNLDSNGNEVVHLVGNAATVSSIKSFVASTLAPHQGLALPAASIQLVSATVPLTTLNTMEQTVSSNLQKLRQAGVDLESWGPDIVTNSLNVTVHDLTTQNKSTLESLFGGSQNLELESDTGVATTLSRTVDTGYLGYPWLGGDQVINNIGNECTSGFPMEENGATLNVTAGHCSGGTGGNYAFTQGGHGYGFPYQRLDCYGCLGDWESITAYPGSATGYVYTGAINSSSNEIVGGVGGNQQTGEKACFDGYAWQADQGFGTVTCVTITQLNTCFTKGSYHTCDSTRPARNMEKTLRNRVIVGGRSTITSRVLFKHWG